MQPMKPILLALALLACTSLAPAQETKSINSAEAAVLNAELSWETALTKADVGALQTLYDDTLVYTHSNGKVDSKASYIDTIKSGATKYESMNRDDIKVNVYGEAAVVTCHWEVHIASRGNTKTAGNWWRMNRRGSVEGVRTKKPNPDAENAKAQRNKSAHPIAHLNIRTALPGFRWSALLLWRNRCMVKRP